MDCPSITLNYPVYPSVNLLSNPIPNLGFYVPPFFPTPSQFILEVTGSGPIQTANFTGIGGSIIFTSGNFIFISGGQGGGAGGTGTNVQITGSSYLNVANFTGIGGTIVFTSGGFVYISGGAGSGSFDSLGTAANTGQILFNIITGMSGQNISNFATISNVTQTGIIIGNQINALSGYVGNSSGAIQNEINSLTTNLILTGVTLENQLNSLSGFTTGLSGYGTLNYATLANLTLTGVNIENQLNALSGFTTGLSGFANSTYPTIINLIQTGINIELQINSLSGFVTGLSGFSNSNYATINNLIQTGVKIESQLSSLSGFITGIINSPSTGVVQLNAPNGRIGFPTTSILLYPALGGSTNNPIGFIGNNSISLTYINFAGYTGINLNIPVVASGSATGGFFIGYSNNFATGFTGYVNNITSNNCVVYTPGMNIFTSGFQPIVTGARSGVYISVMTTGTTGQGIIVGMVRIDLM